MVAVIEEVVVSEVEREAEEVSDADVVTLVEATVVEASVTGAAVFENVATAGLLETTVVPAIGELLELEDVVVPTELPLEIEKLLEIEELLDVLTVLVV